jgi:hypothetical protein
MAPWRKIYINEDTDVDNWRVVTVDLDRPRDRLAAANADNRRLY